MALQYPLWRLLPEQLQHTVTDEEQRQGFRQRRGGQQGIQSLSSTRRTVGTTPADKGYLGHSIPLELDEAVGGQAGLGQLTQPA